MRFGSDKLLKTLVCIIVVSAFALTISCAQNEQDKQEQAKQYQIKANNLRLMGYLNDALAEQKKAVDLTPDDVDTLKILAGMYEEKYDDDKQGKYLQEAKILLAEVIELAPNDALAHNMMGSVLDQIEVGGDKKQAIAEQKEAVRLDPKNADYLNSLGSLYGEIDDVKSQRECYEKALKISPDFVLVVHNLALVEKDAGNYDKSIELFKRSMELDKDNAEITKQRIQEVETLKSLAKKTTTTKP